MVPATIRRLLTRLRTRERLLALAWSAARWFVVCAAVLVLAGLTDWLVDRRRDTPAALLVCLLGVQVVLWVTALGFVFRVLLRRRGDDELALAIEARIPALRHRLISAVQLNRPGAKVAGMSPDLIAAVTRQAEEQANAIDLSQVCDGSRWRRALLVAGPVVAALLLLVAVAPTTCFALVNRLFLGDAEIPRSLALESMDDEVWPAGEEGLLRIRVQGTTPAPDTTGEVRLEFDEAPAIRLELRHHEEDVFFARVPPGDLPFRYRAWLADGRLRQPGQIRYEPRPLIQDLRASVLLPLAIVGKQPTGERYEEIQRGGDVEFRLHGCQARLDLAAQMPLESGEVRIEGGTPRTVSLVVAGEKATATFDLLADDRAYAIQVRNRFGFVNTEVPRRAIRQLPLEPPQVEFLPEVFQGEKDTGPLEDREMEGIPILLGERFAMAYRATARYGLSHVRIRYRVLPRTTRAEEESGPIDREKFHPLPLGPERNAKTRPSPKAREEFWTRTPAEPRAIPDTEGGGRYDFNVTGIPDGKGGLLELHEGDRIQFYVEAFSKADPDGVPGRSTVREKEIVDVKAYLAWLRKKDDLQERTRFLEEQQRMVRPTVPDRGAEPPRR